MTAQTNVVQFSSAKRLTAQDIAERCEGATQHGSYWKAKCPAHDDKQPSLTISTGDDGHVLLHCHAGCSTDVILMNLDLSFVDLMPSTNGNGKAKSLPAETVYSYLREDGKSAYQSVRYYKADGKHFFQRQPDGKGGWINNITDPAVEPLPYRLPTLIEAVKAGKTIYVVEGEKDVDNLKALGFVATTNHGGAGKWSDKLNVWLIDADVVIVPDNDEPGRKHTADVARKLNGIARQVRTLILPDLPPKGDVSDWIAKGGTAEQLQALTATALDARQAAPEAVEKTSAPPRHVAKRISDLRNAQPPEQLTPEMTAHSLGVIFGPSETYKTFYVLDCQLLPMVTAGRKAAFVSAETDDNDLYNRIDAYCTHHKIDASTIEDRLLVFTEPVYLMQPDDVAAFVGTVKDFAPDIIVIDTLAVCALGADENSSRDMGALIDACRRIIRETSATVALVHHSGKSSTSERGSSALRAQCDWMIELALKDVTIVVTDSKRRRAAHFDTYYLRPIDVGNSRVLIPDNNVIQTADDKLTVQQTKALEALALETFVEAGAKATQIADIAHIAADNIYRILSALKRLGYVKQSAKGDPYYITPTGRARLSSAKPHNDAQKSEQSNNRHELPDGTVQPSTVNRHHRHIPLGMTVTTVGDRSTENGKQKTVTFDLDASVAAQKIVTKE